MATSYEPFNQTFKVALIQLYPKVTHSALWLRLQVRSWCLWHMGYDGDLHHISTEGVWGAAWCSTAAVAIDRDPADVLCENYPTLRTYPCGAEGGTQPPQPLLLGLPRILSKIAILTHTSRRSTQNTTSTQQQITSAMPPSKVPPSPCCPSTTSQAGSQMTPSSPSSPRRPTPTSLATRISPENWKSTSSLVQLLPSTRTSLLRALATGRLQTHQNRPLFSTLRPSSPTLVNFWEATPKPTSGSPNAGCWHQVRTQHAHLTNHTPQRPAKVRPRHRQIRTRS